MTEQQKVSAIKRINERLADIKRGVDKGEIPRSYYDRFRDAIELNIPAEYLTRSGNISHGKKAAQNIPDSVITALESRQTRGEIRESAKQHIMDENPFDYETPDDIPDAAIDEYLGDADFVNEALTDDYDECYSAFKYFFQGESGKKSYADLKEAIILFRESGGSGQHPEKSVEEIYFA